MSFAVMLSRFLMNETVPRSIAKGLFAQTRETVTTPSGLGGSQGLSHHPGKASITRHRLSVGNLFAQSNPQH
jgi:hypothetical protein